MRCDPELSTSLKFHHHEIFTLEKILRLVLELAYRNTETSNNLVSQKFNFFSLKIENKILQTLGNIKMFIPTNFLLKGRALAQLVDGTRGEG